MGHLRLATEGASQSNIPAVSEQVNQDTCNIRYRSQIVSLFDIICSVYFTLTHKEAIIKELEEKWEGGIIVESSSEWASPLVVVTKKDCGMWILWK